MKLEDIEVGKTYRLNTKYSVAGKTIIPKGKPVTITSVVNGKAWTKYSGMLIGLKPSMLSK